MANPLWLWYVAIVVDCQCRILTSGSQKGAVHPSGTLRYPLSWPLPDYLGDLAALCQGLAVD